MTEIISVQNGLKKEGHWQQLQQISLGYVANAKIED